MNGWFSVPAGTTAWPTRQWDEVITIKCKKCKEEFHAFNELDAKAQMVIHAIECPKRKRHHNKG